jgi:hypothetical protein
MWMDADSDEEGRGGDDDASCPGAEHEQEWDLAADRAYWRRRFLILCGAIVALGACAWLFPGAHQPSRRDAAAVSASVAALARQQALPPAATGPAWPGATGIPDVYPTVPASPAKATQAAKPAKKASTVGHPRPGPSAFPAPRNSACAPAHIVLSLSTSRPSYAKGAHPRFSVYAVSTSATPCTLTYGAGSVRVVVTLRGHVVWDSTACKPAPAGPVRFTLGVPQVVSMVWNPEVAKPAGCAGALPAVTSAALDAVAMSHGESSPVRTFKLSR